MSAVNANNNSAAYSYLANSPLVSQITFKQSAATRMSTAKTYDNLNRLTQVSSAPSGTGVPPVSFNYNYNPANQRTKDILADGSYWVYSYDALGQVTGGNKYFRDGTPVPGQQFGYSFDTIGNRTQIKVGGDQTGANQRVVNYTNNVLNQLTSRGVTGTNDVIGAALATNSVTVNGLPAFHKGEYFWQPVGTNNGSSPAWEQVTAASGGNTTTGGLYVPENPEQFSYDPDGNLTNDGRWSYTWDAENRLIGMALNTGVGPQYQLSFAYDAKGRRIQKSVVSNSVALYTDNFLYDGWNLVAILNPPSTVVESFLWGNDLSGSPQGAGGVGGLLEVSYNGSATTNCFPAFDGNGNLAALVNAANGTLVANYEYGPFGEVIRSTGPMAKVNPMRFSTKYQDDESDLLYYGYRYYKPSTGTWVSRDPMEEDGGNDLYSFVSSDPINKTDLLGQYEIDFHFYVIYYLMRAKCYSPSEAYDIAYNSQNVDDDHSTNPQLLGEREFVAWFVSDSLYNYWAKRLARYHFINSTQTTGTRAGDPSAVSAARSGLLAWSGGSGSAVNAGISLHVLADTWAHHDFTAFWDSGVNTKANPNHSDLTEDPDFSNYPAIGHAKYGHRPDEPYLRPRLALSAPQLIFSIIPDKQSCGCTPLSLSTVNSDLEKQFSNSGSEYERAVAGQQMIESRFGESVWYPDHSF